MAAPQPGLPRPAPRYRDDWALHTQATQTDHAFRPDGWATSGLSPRLEGRILSLLTKDRGFDVVVHAAGFTRDQLMVRMADPDFDDVVAVHLTGAFLCSRQAVPGMIARRWGRIVYVVSPTALLGRRGQANYGVAKAGLIGLCRALAREVGPFGITVNCVSAGLVHTRLTAELSPGIRAELVAAIPLGRGG